MHRDGIHIWNVVATEGALAQMVLHDGMGLNWPAIIQRAGGLLWQGQKGNADNFSDTVKFVILLGQYRCKQILRPYYARPKIWSMF